MTKRKYNLKERLRKSYESYKRRRQALIEKGYALAEQENFQDYKKDFELAKRAGLSNNFARNMAQDDLRVTRDQAREIYNRMNDSVKEEFNVKTFKQLRSAPNVREIISFMFEAGIITDHDEFEKSLGY